MLGVEFEVKLAHSVFFFYHVYVMKWKPQNMEKLSALPTLCGGNPPVSMDALIKCH